MKKNRIWTTILCLLLCTCMLTFSACDEEKDNENGTGESGTSERTDHENITDERGTGTGEGSTSHTHSLLNGACTGCEAKAYALTFVSNGDGTCYVSRIETFLDYLDDYVLEIPATSPEGDRVTAVSFANMTRAVPMIISAQEYDKIDAELLKKVESEELTDFYYGKFGTYFTFQSVESKVKEEAKEQLLRVYPFVTAIPEFYTYVTDTSPLDDRWVYSHLEMIGYSSKDIKQGYLDLLSAIEASDAANKEEMRARLLEIIGSTTGGIIEIRLPETVTETDASIYASCPDLRTVQLPDCVTTIPSCWLQYSNLTSVILPETTTAIEMIAFGDSTELVSIVLPKRLERIENGAFEGCDALKTVYYGGSAEDWSAIKIQRGNECLTENATLLFYSETEPSGDGAYWRYVDGVPTAW